MSDMKKMNEWMTAARSILGDKDNSNTIFQGYTSSAPVIKDKFNEDDFELLLGAMQQIADCDSMTSAEYEKKYGEHVDYDPYVIAHNVLEALRKR